MSAAAPATDPEADRRAGVFAGLAEHSGDKIGRAIGHFRLLGEVGRGVHEHAQLQAAHHPVQVAAARRLQLRQKIDGAQLRRRLADFHAGIAAQLGDILHRAVLHGHLARNEHLVAADGERHIAGDGRGRRGIRIGRDVHQPRMQCLDISLVVRIEPALPPGLEHAVELERGLIVHVPAGQKFCNELIDLHEGSFHWSNCAGP